MLASINLYFILQYKEIMVEEIKKLRLIHKELFEIWKAELNVNDQKNLDINFSL